MDTASRNIKNDIRLLRRNNSVRKVAQAIEAGETVSYEMAEKLLAKIRDNFWWSRREQLVAAWAVGYLPLTEAQQMDGIRSLTRLLMSRNGSRAKRVVESLTRYMILFGGFGMLLALYTLFDRAIRICLDWLPGMDARLVRNLAAGAAGFVGLMGYLLLDIVDNNTIRMIAMDSIKRIGGWESVGSLVTAALGFNQSVSRSAQMAIIQVLPDLSIEDRRRIDVDTKVSLAALLGIMQTARFSVADDRLRLQVLLLLRDIGSGESVSAVEKIARSDTSPSRRQLASEILSLLRARVQKEQDSTGLLRIAENGPDQFLLRPALGSAQQPTDDLLRAASSTSFETDVPG